MTKQIKSITPVQRGNGWQARIRYQDGTQEFHGSADGYTMHQAQMLCDSLRREFAYYGSVGEVIA